VQFLNLIHNSSHDRLKSNKARDPKLKKYLDTVRRMEASFEVFSVKTSQEEITSRQIY
jgi:hypothetical protein